jgi:hypothetical protein
MKHLLPAIFLLLTALPASAQFKTIAESPEFDEPEKGYTRILQLSSGYTVYFRITLKKGIDIRIYDEKHKEKVVTNIQPAYGDLGWATTIANTFEINDDVVILIGADLKKSPVLIRLLVDGKTGQLKKEERLAEMSKVNYFRSYAIGYGDLERPGFYANTSSSKNYYAVACFNTFESDRNKRIEIIVYGTDHKEISRAFYNSPEEKYKYLDYLDMEVLDNGRVAVLVNGYNTRASGKKGNEILLGELQKAASQVSFNALDFPKDSMVYAGKLRYDAATKKMIVVVSILMPKSEAVFNYLAFADLDARKAVKTVPLLLPADKVYGWSSDMFAKKIALRGSIRDIYIDDDNTFSIALEEEEIVGSSHFDDNMMHDNRHMVLSNAAIAVYNREATLLNTFLIAKTYSMSTAQSTFAADYGFSNQYKRFGYINTGSKKYILMNDIERNTETVQKGRYPLRIMGLGDCDAYYLPLIDNELIPARKYVFGEPAGRKDNKIAAFAVSAYDKKNNIFATLRTTDPSRGKESQIVWVKP